MDPLSYALTPLQTENYEHRLRNNRPLTRTVDRRASDARVRAYDVRIMTKNAFSEKLCGRGTRNRDATWSGHVSHLERRLQLWGNGKLKELLEEGRTIQLQLHRNPPRRQEDTARVFAKLMMEGKVRAALRIVTGSYGGGSLPLDQVADPESDNSETVRDVLLKKHPPKQPPSVSSLLEPESQPPEPHPVMFEVIDGQLIRNTVLKMDGAAGPSGLDAAA